MLIKNGITYLTKNMAAANLRTDFSLIQDERIKQLKLQAPGKLEELIPQPEDYVNIPARGLSARYLGESGYFLDFSKPFVLKNSIPKLLTEDNGGARKKYLKVQRNHSFDIEDTMGAIVEAKWDVSKEFSAPGINVTSRIDWKLYPDEVRKMFSDPPLLDGASFALNFLWEQSHPDMRWWQFMESLGLEVDGEIVRLVVNEILEYYHFGLVWEGADEEAGQINASKEKKVDAGREENSGLDSLPTKKNLSNNIKLNTNQIHKEENMDGLTIKNLSALQDLLGDNVKDETELLSAVQGLCDAAVDLRQKIKDQKLSVELGEQYLKDTREEVLRLARVVHEGELEETREELILKANLETLQMLNKDYQAQEAKLFPNICQDCGSQNIKLRSSREDTPAEGAVSSVDESQFKIEEA